MSLDHATTEEVRNAYAVQKKETECNWTFYEERAFMENLLQTRFNFLIAVYAIFCSVYFMPGQNQQLPILILGLVITILMWITILRIYIKVDVLLKILYALGDQHTSTMVKKILRKTKICSCGVNHLIGIILPGLLVASFCIGIAVHITNPANTATKTASNTQSQSLSLDPQSPEEVTNSGQ